MQYVYKLISIETIEGIKEAEQLKAKGWTIVNNSPFSIQFRVRVMPIESVEKGNFFRLQGGKKVYTHKGYCRINKKYEGQDWGDIGNCIYKKKGTIVEVDFEF